jgi:hypothetical protein
MADTVVTAPPFIVTHPLIKIGATGSAVEFECGATNLDITVDQDENTVETFCGSYTSYKAPKWTVTITIAQSYGANGTWTLLHPLCGTLQPFSIQPDSAAPSVSNPNMSGTAMLKQLPFISAAPGEASEVDLELAVQGTPLFGITAPAMVLETGTPSETPAETAAA